MDEMRIREEMEKEILALREGEKDSMMKDIRRLPLTDQVPIAYAVDKLLDYERSKNCSNSRQWCQRYLINVLSQDLQIVKIRNRYKCNKRRVDVLDFKVWFVKDWLRE